MNDAHLKELCLALMKANTEDEVVQLLKNEGYWDNQEVWRYFGDLEDNWGTIGNQQSSPDAAIVEKIVNSVDARLINECHICGIDPESSSAPQSIRDAVKLFFEDATHKNLEIAGQIKNWSDAKRTEIGRGITLASTGATGSTGNPCFTISDCGEGQTPKRIPETILSLIKGNKLRIPFVQGKYNMGGTGVLKFCGHHNFQLVLSRRNPAIVEKNSQHDSDTQWGFSIVRREDPEGGRRNSVYTYLAPMGADSRPRKGGILSFSADAMPIFPENREAYARKSERGTLIKLYEYKVTGHKTNILRKGGILGRLDLLLPDVALPVRLYECRKEYRGHPGSFETTLTGLRVRLEDDKGNNLEEGFPSSCQISASGERMAITIYAFKPGRADTYKKNEGVIFTLNGQTQGRLTKDLFRRRSVGLTYLADSILVTVDCSNFTGRSREDLFMNSRDRLSDSDLRADIEKALVDLLKQHDGLRSLKEKRRYEELESKLEDSKPLEEILQSLLKKSPALSSLFIAGTRISNPFKARKVRSEEDQQFQGKQFPTYFRFRGKQYEVELRKDCHINMRCRVQFETDAANDYLDRDTSPGEFALYRVVGDLQTPVEDYTINLYNGIATLNIQLPPNCAEGDELRFLAHVTDISQIEPFENFLVVTVREPGQSNGKKGKRNKPPSEQGGDDREAPSALALPKITEVYEKNSVVSG